MHVGYPVSIRRCDDRKPRSNEPHTIQTTAGSGGMARPQAPNAALLSEPALPTSELHIEFLKIDRSSYLTDIMSVK